MEAFRSNCYLEGFGDDDQLIQKLLDNASPFCILPQESMESSNSSPSNDSFIINLLESSDAFYGSTITDLESVLSGKNYISQPEELSQARIQMVEGGLMSKSSHDHKYTLRVKSSNGNAMADDGYKWRKYGQKFIKNNPNPRSYYRCTNPRCGAKKQVEKSNEEQDTHIITYEGLHLHYIFPFFSLNEDNNNQNQIDPPTKKLKKSSPQKQENQKPQQALIMENQEMNNNSQGLLEDMVPLMIRKPLMINANNINNSNSSSSSSYQSTPSSPSILSWSPIQCSPLGFNRSIYEDLVNGE